MLTLYLVRHGEVHNPDGIIYGRLPGFGLSATGRSQIEAAGQALAAHEPFAALYASPLQRAQESAAILAGQLGLPVETQDLLAETDIGGYQGQPFSALPRPYITEQPTHDGIESAASIRSRMLGWAEVMQARHPGQRLVAVSHRDPIIVAVLHWMGRGLAHLPDFDLKTGGVYRVQLKAGVSTVERVI
jgi:broad specificity phosphatase PhoE